MPIEITAVQGRRQLREFIDLPFRLHAGTPWVTPLLVERKAFLSKRLNAFFKHGEAEYFLARRDGRVVGRITAQIDFAYNQFHGTRTGMFGFIEFEDDPEILRALLGTVEAWLVARGCDQMLGPMDFSLNEEGGVLIEGFELEPLVRQSWHPPYYQERIEAEGLTKAMDLLSWKLSVDDRTKMKPVIEKLAKRCREKYGVTVRKMTRRSLRKDLDKFADVYNEAWSENWGFVPYSKADLDAYAFDLQLVFSPEWFMVAEKDGETIAMAITVMDGNQMQKRMKGKVVPTGWISYLRRNSYVDQLRVGFLGVKPAWRHTGVAALLYLEHFEAAANSNLKHGEAGFILETNRDMNAGLEAMNGRVVKKHRVYERALRDPAGRTT
ncbi:MAG TPA: GNAT family N-acetyltransferase [Solirubrobacterales bacterium]|nr:GNAT family N-acetyltransferase [Solirubrobacterales bacterium]